MIAFVAMGIMMTTLLAGRECEKYRPEGGDSSLNFTWENPMKPTDNVELYSIYYHAHMNVYVFVIICSNHSTPGKSQLTNLLDLSECMSVYSRIDMYCAS